MIQSFNAKEIAHILSCSTRNIQRRAVQDNWPYDERVGLGGVRRVYAFTNLPKDVQAAILETDHLQSIQHIQPLDFELAPPYFKGQQPLTYLTKAFIQPRLLRLAQHYAAQTNQGKIKGFDNFCTLYNQRQLNINPTLYTTIKTLSRITLLRWEKRNSKQLTCNSAFEIALHKYALTMRPRIY